MTAPDPTPLDLDAIRADVEYAGSGIDGADLPYHPHALAAMRAAETLLADVERLSAERDALDMANARPAPVDLDEAWQELRDERDQLRDDLAACRAERDTRARAFERHVADLATSHRVELDEAAAADDDLRTELARTTARRDEIWRQFLALDRELADRDEAQATVRAAVAEEIAAAIEAQDARGYAMYEAAYRESAEIARGHATPPDALTLGPVGTVMLALADGGFHEDDEPAGDVVAAFETGVRRLTAPPTLDGPSTRAEGTHHYLSTACYHGHHNQCRQTCKFCPAECRCTCHPLTEAVDDPQR